MVRRCMDRSRRFVKYLDALVDFPPKIWLGAINGDSEKGIQAGQIAGASTTQLMAVAGSDFANNLTKNQRSGLNKSQMTILFGS